MLTQMLLIYTQCYKTRQAFDRRREGAQAAFKRKKKKTEQEAGRLGSPGRCPKRPSRPGSLFRTLYILIQIFMNTQINKQIHINKHMNSLQFGDSLYECVSSLFSSLLRDYVTNSHMGMIRENKFPSLSFSFLIISEWQNSTSGKYQIKILLTYVGSFCT